MLKVLLASVVLAGFLSGCGGGGGGPSPSSPPNPPIVVNPNWEVGYFGGDLDSISKTAPYISYYNVPDWGDWDTPTGRSAINTRIINEIQKAKDLGIPGIVLDVGFTLFDSHLNYRGTSDLVQLISSLATTGLDQRIIAVIILDEPDLRIDDATYSAILEQVKPLIKWPLMVIYSNAGSNHTYPGLKYFTFVGVDDYPRGVDVLRSYPQLSANQFIVLLPGGANPWRADPRPFADYACSHANVWGLMSFIYVDYTEQGIGKNGLKDTYNQLYTNRCQ